MIIKLATFHKCVDIFGPVEFLPDSSREADHRVEKAICVEIFKHALNRLAINPKGDTGHTEV